jgi:hypothetical protein
MDCNQFIQDFQDYLAPKLDTYEQAVYLYIFRHSRFLGKDQVVIGFRSARSRMAYGIGAKGKPMSDKTGYVKLLSLQQKGCIEILDSQRSGRLIRLKLPHEINGVIPKLAEKPEVILEAIDFFESTIHRVLLLEREEHKCFYCLRALNKNNYVIEHVVSRPTGDNSYRNCVAACRECNNKKNDTPVEDFLRLLYRGSVLTALDLEERLNKLSQLRAGELRPSLDTMTQ